MSGTTAALALATIVITGCGGAMTPAPSPPASAEASAEPPSANAAQPERDAAALLAELDKRSEIDVYESRVREAAALCGLSPGDLAGVVRVGQLIAEQQGLWVSNFELLGALIAPTRRPAAGTVDCEDVILLHLVLRQSGL
jgi:hypothetical protein